MCQNKDFSLYLNPFSGSILRYVDPDSEVRSVTEEGSC